MMNTKVKPLLCLDFDGVIHSYVSGWKGATVIEDPPVPGAIEFIEDALNHFRVAIFSSRSAEPGGVEAMQQWLVSAWVSHISGDSYEIKVNLPGCRTYVRDFIEWPLTKPAAFLTIDDRAMTFTGRWPKPEQLLRFQPWTRVGIIGLRAWIAGLEAMDDKAKARAETAHADRKVIDWALEVDPNSPTGYRFVEATELDYPGRQALLDIEEIADKTGYIDIKPASSLTLVEWLVSKCKAIDAPVLEARAALAKADLGETFSDRVARQSREWKDVEGLDWAEIHVRHKNGNEFNSVLGNRVTGLANYAENRKYVDVPRETFERVSRILNAAFHALKSYEYGNQSAVLAGQVTAELATTHFRLTGTTFPGAPPPKRAFAWARGVHTPSSPNGPAEYDVEIVCGDDRPDGDCWFPLYRE